jgi:cytochrome c biogenesis protein CcmG, thiol:disulfide interchange protein DsbE
LSKWHHSGISNAVILRFFIWSALFSLGFHSWAAPMKLDFLKVGSKVYSNVTIIGANATDLYFTHNQGISNVKLRNVDEDLRKSFNYDPKLAEKAERQQFEDDSTYVKNLASSMAAKAQKAARAAQKAAITSEDNLADPISEQSLLGKAAPSVQVEKWIEAPPSLKGKVVLIMFWEPWSIPCRKAITDLNALQKKFGEKLVVIGLTSETKEEVEASEVRPEFPFGIDTKARLSNAAGVNSVPYSILTDATGIVRYQGHPSALDEKKLERLIAKVEL